MKRKHAKVGLTPRIGIIIVLAFLATQLLDKVLVAIVPPPPVLFYTRAWLADNVAEAVRIANATAAEHRARRLDSASSAWLTYSVSDERPLAQSARAIELETIRASIEHRVASEVVAFGAPIEDPERQTRPISVVLPVLPSLIEDIMDDELREEVIAAGHLQIAVRLADGSWLYATEPTRNDVGALRMRNAMVIVGGLLLIAAFAALTARMVIRPLRELAAAADRLGRERELTPIAPTRVAEIDTIAESFNRMQERLKRFVDERTSMLAAISHDLRTPLTRLRLFAEEVRDPAQRDQLLHDVGEMEQMIRASLAFASDDVHREAHARVDVAALLISLCDTFADTGHIARYEGPNHAELSCRASATRRMFSNLIDNACKYGYEADVRLLLRAEAIEVTIADRGPGIPADLIEQAFAPFRRLDLSRNRESGGVGLGLAIARDVVHEHGGSLTLEGRSPSGLIARVVLPKPQEH